MAVIYEPLTEHEWGWVCEQLDAAGRLARDFVTEYEPRVPSLGALDQLLANCLEWEGEPQSVVQAVGVAFGTHLIAGLGFRWVMASDDRGPQLALLARPFRGDVAVYPVEVVAQRLARGESFFLTAAYEEVRQTLQRTAAEWGGP